ncbi:MAG TPA: retropepsin-like aspartic protease, partial [Puia sp.]
MKIANKTISVCLTAAACKILSSFLLALILFSGVHAQKNSNPGSSKLITQVPFTTFTGGVVVIRAVLIGFPDTLNFIIDTGSGGISLDSITCIRLNIKPVLTDRLITGIGGVRQLRYVNNQSLIVGNLKIDSLNFHVSDYDILSSVYGDRIDGIIGYSFFSRYIVKIDYDSNEMYVYSKGNMKYPKGGFTLKPNIVNLPVVGAMLRDTKEVNPRFYF